MLTAGTLVHINYRGLRDRTNGDTGLLIAASPPLGLALMTTGLCGMLQPGTYMLDLPRFLPILGITVLLVATFIMSAHFRFFPWNTWGAYAPPLSDLTWAISEGDPTLRLHAAEQLARRKTPDSVAALLPMTNDPDVRVRTWALLATRQPASDSILDDLMPLLQDPESRPGMARIGCRGIITDRPSYHS